MGASGGGLASLVAECKRQQWTVLAALALFPALIPITGTYAGAETAMKRAVLGTIVSPGTVQIASEPHAWAPGGTGTPVLEDSQLRTGTGQTTVLELGEHGVIGLRERSHLNVGKSGSDGLPLSLQGESSLSFRLPLASELSIFTDTAVVRGPAGGEVPSKSTSVQGIVTQQGNQTTVSVIQGRLRVRNRGAEEFAWVGDGEQATITAAHETPRIARMTEASKEEARGRLGVLGWFGTKTGLAVTGAAAVGGGVGAAAATGAFSGDDDSDQTRVPAQGSPFSP